MTKLSAIRDNIRHKGDMIRRILWRYSTLNPAMEVVYRDLFVRDLGHVGIADEYYPVGGAANHGLLYLLLRSLREFDVGATLEFGAGQSTLLFDAVRRTLRPNMDVITVEHDAEWAERMRALVSHRVVYAPLAAATVDGRAIDYYANGFIPAGAQFNLVLIDGPPADGPMQRFARSGCLALLPDILARDFMVIIDDAEREGEAHLVARLAERFGPTVRQATIAAAKQQAWFCGGAYARAAYF